MRNKAYFAGIAGKQRQQRDKRQDKRHGKRQRRGRQKPLHPAPPATGGHDNRHKERATTAAPTTPKTKIYLNFCRFWSPKIPRKHKTTSKNYLFLPVLGLIFDIWGECLLKKGIPPPPIAERQVPFIPIIFRAIKVEKSSPKENIIFRTENIAKSQPAFSWKKFRKFFSGECFGGKRNAPNLGGDWGRGANYKQKMWWCIQMQR